MTILTRENLIDGSFRSRLGIPSHLALSDAELERSLHDILNARPDGPIWIFAYGSLLWNPLLAYDELQSATLDGWQRSFCVRSVCGRGSPERPGRVLALEPGRQVQGVALRLREKRAESELRMLWAREMVSGAYRPLWIRVMLDEGHEVPAITFVANPDQAPYEADAKVQTVARIVADATGAFGTNAQYVHMLHSALARHGLRDPYVDAIVSELQRSDDGAPRSPSEAPSA